MIPRPAPLAASGLALAALAVLARLTVASGDLASSLCAAAAVLGITLAVRARRPAAKAGPAIPVDDAQVGVAGPRPRA